MESNLINSADIVGMFCRLYMNTKRDMPIRASEMGVLIFIQKQTVSVTPIMISQFFKIAKPSVTAIINVLMKKEYLTKEPALEDGRSYTLRTTEKGKNLVEITFDEYFKSMELLNEKMGEEEFTKLIELLQKANNILAEVK